MLLSITIYFLLNFTAFCYIIDCLSFELPFVFHCTSGDLQKVCNFCVSRTTFLLLILFLLTVVWEISLECSGAANVHLQISFNLNIHKKGATSISMIFRYILNVISLSSIAEALYLNILLTKILYAKAHNLPDIYI